MAFAAVAAASPGVLEILSNALYLLSPSTHSLHPSSMVSFSGIAFSLFKSEVARCIGGSLYLLGLPRPGAPSAENDRKPTRDFRIHDPHDILWTDVRTLCQTRRQDGCGHRRDAHRDHDPDVTADNEDRYTSTW